MRQRPSWWSRSAATGLVVAALAALAIGTAPSVEEIARQAGVHPLTPPEISIVATGDILIHGSVADRARTGGGYDFRPMLRDAAPILSGADVAVCHLEVPLSSDNTRLRGYPSFNAPSEVGAALYEAGFDACTTASNHALDRGAAGIDATLDVLDEAAIAHAGTARVLEQRGPALIDVGGARVALLSYTYGTNGIPRPAPWMVDLIDPDLILADAARARAEGAGIVVVGLHWGAEYRSEPTPQQREIAQRLLGSPDIDLVWGHHAHVVQPVERIGGKFVVYGMGNFLSGQTDRLATQSGTIFRFDFERRGGSYRLGDVTYAPTWTEPRTYRVLLVSAALHDPSVPAWRHPALQASWRDTVRAVSSLGAGEAGVSPKLG